MSDCFTCQVTADERPNKHSDLAKDRQAEDISLAQYSIAVFHAHIIFILHIY